MYANSYFPVLRAKISEMLIVLVFLCNNVTGKFIVMQTITD